MKTMVTFKATRELKTPLWKKFLRWIRVIKHREEFEVCYDSKWYSKGDVIISTQGQFKLLDDGR